jgi:hypothetical protein
VPWSSASNAFGFAGFMNTAINLASSVLRKGAAGGSLDPAPVSKRALEGCK